jgi:hypothetical protein
MKSRTVGFVALCAWVLPGALWIVAPSSGQATPGQERAEAADGLQMSIAVAKRDKNELPVFEVAFQNTGERDITLNLGMMLANGKVQLPDRIRLKLKDAAGIRELHFSDKRYPGVAGRVDDYVVPLRAGSTYTLRLTLDQFWSPSTKEFVLELKPGQYQVSAQFEGSGAKTNNIGSEGIRLMNFWKGKLQSGAVSFEH